MIIGKKMTILLLFFTLLLSTLSFASVIENSQSDVNLKLKYPLVYINNPLAQEKINQDIANRVLYAKDLYYNKKEFEVRTFYDITFEDERYLSIIFYTYYWNGLGVHGLYTGQGLVYDKETGDKIPLEYFVTPPTAEQINQFSYGPLISVYSESNKILTTHYPIKECSHNYCLPGNGSIDLLYQPYFLASFAAGVTHVRLSPAIIEYFNRQPLDS